MQQFVSVNLTILGANYVGCDVCSINPSVTFLAASSFMQITKTSLEMSCINVISRTYQTFFMSKNELDKHLPCFIYFSIVALAAALTCASSSLRADLIDLSAELHSARVSSQPGVVESFQGAGTGGTHDGALHSSLVV